MSLLLALQGGAPPATITADLAATEAQDTTAFALSLIHTAALAATEVQDTASFAASLIHTSALAVIEAQDVAAFSSTVIHVSDLAATEAGDIAAFAITVEGGEQADTHDGVGGALITYKRPHKKVHDEIEEYFDLRTPTEAEKVIDAIAEAAHEAIGAADQAARDTVAGSLQAKSFIAALLDEQRNAELRVLLSKAMDEDDAEAVLVMLELSR